MPDGPLLLSPDRMMKSMYREVIIKKPHLFKIKCLKEVKDLFPEHSEPFYAGFGNRDTDYISYRTLSISSSKIFIINPKGEVSQFNNNFFQKSYPMINEIYDMMFPSIEGPPQLANIVIGHVDGEQQPPNN
jgi:phosphatidate phosphatase LPIN